MASLKKLIPPATRQQFSSLGDALMQTPEYLLGGLSQLVNVPNMADDIRKQGYPSAINLGLAALGPASLLQGQIVKGGLRLLPAPGIFTGSNLFGDAMPVVGKAIKKTAAPAAATVAMTPDEAEGGGIQNLILTLAHQINTKAPTVLRPKGQGIGQRMPKEIAKQERLLKSQLAELPTTPEQNENITNIFNSQKYSVDYIIAAVKEALKSGD